MSVQRDICVAVATHKLYRMPDDPAYLPVQVGVSLHPDVDLGFQRDNEGDNISSLNDSYSELTALYWVWKNVDARAKGLVHYRRLLGSSDSVRRRAKDPFGRIATGDELSHLVDAYGVVLPRKRQYVIETVYDHYAHTFDAAHLDACRDVLTEMCPEYVPAWNRHMSSRSAHICNMFVMRNDLFDAYCSWLFPLLKELTGRIDIAGMTSFEVRWPGRVAERLLDPWLELNSVKPVELPVVTPEPVDWVAKGKGFLAAKFLGRKYGNSF